MMATWGRLGVGGRWLWLQRLWIDRLQRLVWLHRLGQVRLHGLLSKLFIRLQWGVLECHAHWLLVLVHHLLHPAPLRVTSAREMYIYDI